MQSIAALIFRLSVLIMLIEFHAIRAVVVVGGVEHSGMAGTCCAVVNSDICRTAGERMDIHVPTTTTSCGYRR